MSHICFGKLKQHYRRKYKNIVHIQDSAEASGKTIFAQFGEDITAEILFFFLYGIVEKTTYLDIGSNDPVKDNNTYYFYKKGGNGVLIEHNPHFHPLYKILRPKDKAIQAGINFSNDQETAEYYDFGEKAHSLNTFSPERKNEVIKQYPLVKTHHIPLVKINDVLASMEKVDFISLDVEGLDFPILKTLDFGKYRPKLFCIEANKEHIDYGFESELVKFMESNYYIVVADNFINLIFADTKQIKHAFPYDLFLENNVLDKYANYFR